MYAIGTPVSYRFWTSDPWQQGTVESYVTYADGSEYVRIDRTGFNETAVMPAVKFNGGAGSAFVTPAISSNDYTDELLSVMAGGEL